MVQKLFAEREPTPSDLLIDAGAGTGPFIEGVLRYCDSRKIAPPRIVGAELNPALIAEGRATLAKWGAAEALPRPIDYLTEVLGPADFIIGNPPYVSITGLDEAEKARYRGQGFASAVQRFDLYLLFFEQSIVRNLKPGGRLVFITPEKFAHVHTAAPLRRLLTSKARIEEIEHVGEETFEGLVTYPAITTITNASPGPRHETLVRFRDGTSRRVRLPTDGRAWTGTMHGAEAETTGLTLGDVCIRVSAGVATGADQVWVMSQAEMRRSYPDLLPYAFPTISGRQLALTGFTEGDRVAKTTDFMLIPYDREGAPIPAERLHPTLSGYLRLHEQTLRARTHLRSERTTKQGKIAKERPLHRFHDSVPFGDMLHPKILCKDITPQPKFWADEDGSLVPRHTVYYAVPIPELVRFDALLAWLNGEESGAWLRAHAQRAANGFLRLQSKVLERLPVPDNLLTETRPRARQARL
ncbi:MAG TPA: Eco57I restriction-modification methylase domain-containing protein [Candidatus Thermoplasmatota archaeon]|nr:Eco57I restriction-modification methylase domain-containing protein [Candidatus Thermoplasmatota archaeon]